MAQLPSYALWIFMATVVTFVNATESRGLSWAELERADEAQLRALLGKAP